MRANRWGWFLLALFLIGGIAFWIAMPEIWLGQIWVGVSVILGVILVVMFMRAERADEFKRTGTPGQAHILEMDQTGVYVNNQPRMKLRLRIEAPGVAPFEDTSTHTIPLVALGRLTAGVPLAVYLSREDPSEYTIDWFNTTQGSAPGFAMTGPMTVQSSSGGMVDVGANAGAAAAVMNALSDHGIDASSGSIDLTQLPAARDAVLKALESNGIDVAHQVAAASPAIPIEDRGEPME
ncbi:MAG TPA: hypothetical protein VIG64_05655, partial [Actinomycetota bacterium]